MSTDAIHVLLVEDNPGDVELMRVLLAGAVEFPFVLRAEERLASAIESLSNQRTDAILLDLTLADAAGIESLARLRATAPGIPVVVMTGLDDERMALAAMQHGAQDYLVKGTADSRLLSRTLRHAIERTRTQRELDEHRRRLGLLLENIPDRVYFKDAAGRFVQVNPALARYFGLSRAEDAIGRCDADFFLAEHANEAMADEREIMRTGSPMLNRVERETFPDGRVGWSLTTKMPLRDAHEQVVGTFGISRDITALMTAEQALRGSEERYRRLLDSVTDYVYSVALRDGQAVSTSHGPGCLAVTGYTPEEFQKDPWLWHRLIHPEDREPVLQRLGRVTSEGRTFEIEHRIIRKDGAVRWVRNRHVPRYAGDGALESYDGLISDITERKLAADELVAANARLTRVLADLTRSHEDLKATQSQLMQAEKLHSIGQLAAGVAHEVKNPLQVMLVGLQVLAEGPLTEADDQTKAVLIEMNEAVTRANVVIRDLLDFASPRELGMQLRPIHAIIEQSLRFVAYEFSRSRVRVVTELAEPAPHCLLDPTKIEQVFVNLFTNAAHAMPEGGTLSIRTSLQLLDGGETPHAIGERGGPRLWAGDHAVVIEIADTGVGICQENLGKVFDPFFTTKSTGKGTGLGLSVTRKIVELHGGHISIANNPDRGVTVKLLFKAAAPASASEQPTNP